MTDNRRMKRIDALLAQWGEWSVTGRTRNCSSSTLGRLVMRTQCPVCRGRGVVRVILRKGGIGTRECSSCSGQGHTTVSDSRVHPHLIPGTNPNPTPDHLIDLDRTIHELPDNQHAVICEHYQKSPWYTAEQHARKAELALRTYERRLHEARTRLADRLWPRKRA